MANTIKIYGIDMKQAIIYVEVCRDCPYTTDHPGARRIKRCTIQDKWVKADEMDNECPLEDVSDPKIG